MKFQNYYPKIKEMGEVLKVPSVPGPDNVSSDQNSCLVDKEAT